MIVDMTLIDAMAVINRARETDLMAWSAFHFDKSADFLAVERYQAHGIRKALLGPDGGALAIGGFQLNHPYTWTAWFIGIDGWQVYTKTVMKFALDVMARMFAEGTAKRIQAWVLASDLRALRFVDHMRFTPEAFVPSLGDGVDFYQFRRVP